MTDQENKNIKEVVNKFALEYLRKKGIKYNLDLSSDNFEKNLIEIVSNPNSQYADNVYLFDKIPKLKDEEEALNDKIQTLKSEVEKLNIKINGNEDVKGLNIQVKELEDKKLDLQNQINGLKEEIKNSNIEFDKLKIETENKVKNKNELVYNISGLSKKHDNLKNQINYLTNTYSIVENLSELKKEARSNLELYYRYVAGMVMLIILSSCFAYWYGDGIIYDITKITDKDSRDYFGMFLMKIPFSLMIITFISGGFIFISKLLVIIERINNQLRNISQISVIASQIDQGAIDLINRKSEIDKMELEEAKTKKEEKNLFYNLIAEYLVNLSKNELELKEKKGSQLNMLKELAEIIHKVKPSSKE